MSTHKVRVIKKLETGLPEPGSWYYMQGVGSFELLVFFLCKIQPLFPGGSSVKKRLPTQETWILSLGQEDPLEKEMATCSSILAGNSRGQRSLVGSSLWGRKSVLQDLATKQRKYEPRGFLTKVFLVAESPELPLAARRTVLCIKGLGCLICFCCQLDV